MTKPDDELQKIIYANNKSVLSGGKIGTLNDETIAAIKHWAATTYLGGVLPDVGPLENTKGSYADGYASAVEDIVNNADAIRSNAKGGE